MKLATVVVLTLALAGCGGDPWCWFATDPIGCLIITDNVNEGATQ